MRHLLKAVNDRRVKTQDRRKEEKEFIERIRPIVSDREHLVMYEKAREAAGTTASVNPRLATPRVPFTEDEPTGDASGARESRPAYLPKRKEPQPQAPLGESEAPRKASA
jgi:hypothetical protein